MNRIIFLASFLLLYSCIQDNKSGSHTSDAPVFMVNAKPCLDEAIKKDTAFSIDTIQVKLSYRLQCIDSEDISDTLIGKDSLKINKFKNKMVRVDLKEPHEVSVIINKELFETGLGKDIIRPLQLGETRIESIDKKSRSIVFSSFIGFPETETGMTVIYAIDLSGDFRFITTEDRQAGD